jgi:hypothetical protein
MVSSQDPSPLKWSKHSLQWHPDGAALGNAHSFVPRGGGKALPLPQRCTFPSHEEATLPCVSCCDGHCHRHCCHCRSYWDHRCHLHRHCDCHHCQPLPSPSPLAIAVAITVTVAITIAIAVGHCCCCRHQPSLLPSLLAIAIVVAVIVTIAITM